MLSEEEFMDAKSLHRQGVSYSEIGRLLGRDWRTVKRYVEAGTQPRYRRGPATSMLDPVKPIIDGWLSHTPPPQAKRIHQDLARDYGFAGSYQTVRRYVEAVRPRPPREPEDGAHRGRLVEVDDDQGSAVLVALRLGDRDLETVS